MPDTVAVAVPTLMEHGRADLPAVHVDSYSAVLRGRDGYVGDHASKRAFDAIVADWRKRLGRNGDDPFGDAPADALDKKRLEKALDSDDLEAAGLVHAAIEEFASGLAEVIRRLSVLKPWRGTERLVIGGGFRASRIGELAIGRAAVALRAEKHPIELCPIRHGSDDAGLLGAAQLAPTWMFTGYDAIVAVDVGGTNIRAGIVELRLKKDRHLAAGCVAEIDVWRHGDDKPSRKEAVARLIGMVERLIRHAAKHKLKLAPFIGIGCPGKIRKDGTIAQGGQNLPGNWQSRRFSLPVRICAAIPEIDGHHTAIVMHNDAVVQGLSEAPFMTDVARWGVLTIGTGLGNARFTNRPNERQ